MALGWVEECQGRGRRGTSMGSTGEQPRTFKVFNLCVGRNFCAKKLEEKKPA